MCCHMVLFDETSYSSASLKLIKIPNKAINQIYDCVLPIKALYTHSFKIPGRANNKHIWYWIFNSEGNAGDGLVRTFLRENRGSFDKRRER